MIGGTAAITGTAAIIMMVTVGRTGIGRSVDKVYQHVDNSAGGCSILPGNLLECCCFLYEWLQRRFPTHGDPGSLLLEWTVGHLTVNECHHQDMLALRVAPAEPVLMCWEVPPFVMPTIWCHRHLVDDWFKATIGIEVPELDIENAGRLPGLWANLTSRIVLRHGRDRLNLRRGKPRSED